MAKKLAKLTAFFIFKKVRSSLITFALFSVSSASYACPSEPYLGSVCITAATFCPKNFFEANGQLISIAQNPELFILLGTMYGGNGMDNFAMPNLQGRSVIGQGIGPGLSPITQGQTLGVESVTLLQNNLPAHTHPVTLTGTANTSVTIPISANSGK